LRSSYEEGQALTVNSYDITLFDFAPDVNLKKFTQKRAFIKTIMKFSDIYRVCSKTQPPGTIVYFELKA